MFIGRISVAARFLFCALVIAAFASQARADLITYQIYNHPHGHKIDDTVDYDGYVLRLDTGRQVNSFNGNHTQVLLTYDPVADPSSIFISGLVTHNESGTDTVGRDANDDVYRLDAKLSGILLKDNTGVSTPWYDPFSPNATFNDIIAALVADANDPDFGTRERSHLYTNDAARIYFQSRELTLTPIDINGGGLTFDSSLTSFEEYGPEMFFQYRWRLWEDPFADAQYDQLGAQGWLKPVGASGPSGTINDFLFVIGDVQPGVVPEPASLALLGLGAMCVLRRRRRTAAA